MNNSLSYGSGILHAINLTIELKNKHIENTEIWNALCELTDKLFEAEKNARSKY